MVYKTHLQRVQGISGVTVKRRHGVGVHGSVRVNSVPILVSIKAEENVKHRKNVTLYVPVVKPRTHGCMGCKPIRVHAKKENSAVEEMFRLMHENLEAVYAERPINFDGIEMYKCKLT